MNNTNCDRNLLKQNFDEAMRDPSFAYVTTLVDVDQKYLMNHTSKLKTSAAELKNCKNCKGLLSCKNRVQGFVYYPKKQGPRVMFNYIACKYKRREIESNKRVCDFYDMPAGLKDIRMKDIIIDDSSRVAIIKWLKNFYDTFEENPHQKGLYLHGSFGSGKTFLVCAMLNELAKKGIDISVAYYQDLLRSLKESFDKNFAERIEKLKKVSILFLDDIGAESVTPWGRDEVLGTILQYRMDASLPTFFTSNLSLEELENNLSTTKSGVDKVKARRIIERIKYLSVDMTLVSKNRRNSL